MKFCWAVSEEFHWKKKTRTDRLTHWLSDLRTERLTDWWVKNIIPSTTCFVRYKNIITLASLLFLSMPIIGLSKPCLVLEWSVIHRCLIEGSQVEQRISFSFWAAHLSTVWWSLLLQIKMSFLEFLYEVPNGKLVWT